MPRILLFVIAFLSFSLHANSPLQLDKRLGLNNQNQQQNISIDDQIVELKNNIDRLAANASSFQQAQLDFEKNKKVIDQGLKEATKPLKLDKGTDLNQQASMAYLRLSELKESEAALGNQVNELLQRHNLLPSVIANARQNVLQNKKTELAPIDTPAGELQQIQRIFFEQSLATHEAELASSQKRIELTQLQLQLVRQQLSQQEAFIETINKAINKQRQQQTDATLAKNLVDTTKVIDPITRNIADTNQIYGQKLQTLTLQINNVVEQQEQAELQYQSQAKQLANIQEQITWVKMNSAFGERFLQMLQSLPKPPNHEKLQTLIADARLDRYHLEQQQALNEQELEQANLYNEGQIKLLRSQQALLTQLMQSYDQYLSELGKLKVNYQQLSQQHLTLKNTLNEHLFWVPNAASINKLWLTDIQRSALWLIQQAQWGQLSKAWQEQNDYWSWWIILLVLCLVVQDLIKPKFNRLLGNYATYVGNVTQDKFIYTFKSLVLSLGYALIKPLPIVAAGWIFYQSDRNFVQAVGMGILAIGLVYLLYRLIFILALDKGVLVGHFKRPSKLIQAGQLRLKHFVFVASPLLGIMGFTEILDASLIRNSIGRGAFICFCVVLFLLYKDILLLSRQNSVAQKEGKNKRLIQKMLWALLIAVPLLSAGLAFRGYYFTAFQMLLQLQLSIILGLSFLLLYQLIKRWMLIERRRIAFDRAKAKRAERLAQREKGETHHSSNDGLDTYEEPVVDLETISSQSLGLVRSLLLLAFLASLIGLWTQTHTALFSFLDGITLWTTNTSVNGVEQQLPITMKSLLFGLIIVGFSLMIATNLPGLLELMILQRLDLTPGTGFAITTVSRYLVVFLGLLIGFSNLGMEWSKLQWLIAALSLGLGFGLQEIFANFISGLIILFEKPVRIGDTVTIRDLTGTVSKIQIRATTIIDWDRKEIIIPNKAFITEQLINWSLSDPITRVIVYVSVARDSDPAKVEATLYQAVQECEDALPNPEPEVWFAGFGKHTQDYEVRAYAKDMSARWPLRHDLHKRITRKLKENNLELAYPQMEIHIKNGQTRDQVGIIRS
ncbi:MULTISPECIES: mechanosensitive ion channel domain-containing protein [Shewanella]|uniref:Mechanosensitive ion channel n=1 Tax=Shewanella xiamenensis TaxID=332186 RepID=A0ABT6UFS4_9GAMM|nr:MULTISPECIES: mechanosensitive ion channel domain-containing protein [Shewanella]PZP30089.1 MAG: mechanosensitive ion channel protein MscS [Shewanella oneidensis]MCH7422685.1 mechanosensitive ion channel [Shewanella sp. MM_2022_3]MCT8865257.1 mechanosensitive ion channel [Shewanella xiamenensis]MCT8869528.1 mechanosensitive ion channel [Shewanella xiamenensis]MCT8878234.1 mechanosensitive ion channel [Shewanella xiamenensis]